MAEAFAVTFCLMINMQFKRFVWKIIIWPSHRDLGDYKGTCMSVPSLHIYMHMHTVLGSRYLAVKIVGCTYIWQFSKIVSQCIEDKALLFHTRGLGIFSLSQK
jgi:hypothetical protein